MSTHNADKAGREYHRHDSGDVVQGRAERCIDPDAGAHDVIVLTPEEWRDALADTMRNAAEFAATYETVGEAVGGLNFTANMMLRVPLPSPDPTDPTDLRVPPFERVSDLDLATDEEFPPLTCEDRGCKGGRTHQGTTWKSGYREEQWAPCGRPCDRRTSPQEADRG